MLYNSTKPKSVQLWTNVQSVKLEQSHQFILTGTSPNEQKQELVVPCLISDTYSVAQFAELFDAINERNIGAICPCKSILLAIMGSDSSIVYYRIHDGVRKPLQ